MVAAPLAVTVGETAPQADCGHDTIQATPIFAESLVTVALKLAVARTCTVADVWESDTLMVDDVLELPPPPHPATRAVKTQIMVPVEDWRLVHIEFVQCPEEGTYLR